VTDRPAGCDSLWDWPADALACGLVNIMRIIVPPSVLSKTLNILGLNPTPAFSSSFDGLDLDCNHSTVKKSYQ
jgi:hypothetical protein